MISRVEAARHMIFFAQRPPHGRMRKEKNALLAMTSYIEGYVDAIGDMAKHEDEDQYDQLAVAGYLLQPDGSVVEGVFGAAVVKSPDADWDVYDVLLEKFGQCCSDGWRK
jgi:hypothetical protein